MLFIMLKYIFQYILYYAVVNVQKETYVSGRLKWTRTTDLFLIREAL